MDVAASAAKDVACPAYAPRADLNRIMRCGTRNNCRLPGNFQPGGCWCDQFCNAAGDCCDDCATACGAGVCTNLRRHAAAAAAAAANISSAAAVPELLPCGFTEANDRLRKFLDSRRGGVVPAGMSNALAARVTTCTNALAGTPAAATPVTSIPLVFVSAEVNGDNFVYPREKAEVVVKAMNSAYARAGYRFSIARELTASFDKDEDVRCSTAADPNLCPRCKWYLNNLPADLRSRGVHVMYFFKRSDAVESEAASYTPETLYGDADPMAPSCVDGTWFNSNLDVTNGGTMSPAEAAQADAATAVHEVGASACMTFRCA
uniref:SMB domain-containing protein n=1 Tax=Tetradesmus obliquus TaxID=3088 RepID=A0A383WBG0_TETOB|eukprot:jgi/Sobl393_1/6737/SZX74532.1